MGTKVLVNIGPGIKIDQNYDVFKEGLGTYCETPDHEAYIAKLWAGNCAFPDFVNSKARAFWKKRIKEFVKTGGIDGVWLDMNEPSAFTPSKTFDETVIHTRDDGKSFEHKVAHNAYAYFENLATFEALKELSLEPFVLSRAGCAGVQKFAAIWTGDNVASWENMRLQIPLLTSLSISGVPFVGCNIGGFIGRSDPELLTRYYQMAAFFPVFWNHKGKDGNDQEVFRLPLEFRQKVKKVIEMRHSLLLYMECLAHEAHKLGHPIIRSLPYEFQNDENAYAVNDEYMVGNSLLYAPILEKGTNEREVYLPPGTWMSWEDRNGKELAGEKWVRTSGEMPLYLRLGSIVPTDSKLVIWGKGSRILHIDGSEVQLKSSGSALTSSHVFSSKEIEFLKVKASHAIVDGSKVETQSDESSTFLEVPRFRNIKLEPG